MKKPLFLAGLHLLCISILVLQICITRILSVMTYFHLAFVTISMAMLGLTAGAVYVYLKGYKESDLPALLPKYTAWYAISSVVAVIFLCSTYTPVTGGMNVVAALLKIVMILVVPFTIAGMAIALCLTRGNENGSINLRYAVDLLGAALGCLICIPLLNHVSGPYAVLSAAFIGAVSSMCFAFALRPMPRLDKIEHVVFCGFLLAGLGMLVSVQNEPNSLQVPTFKTADIHMGEAEYQGWNNISNIQVTRSKPMVPFYWGAATNPDIPLDPSPQRYMMIDGLAGTPMYQFDGDYTKLGFLKFDVTNLAYSIRHSGRAAIIGIGGGRDILSARHFGFNDVTAVELNPIMVNLLTKTEPYATYAGIKNDPNIHFNIDDGRNWFARTNEKFNLIQMSMIDTFAATGAGGFTLSENGLYTVEGWQHFLNALEPDGVFTVSRWYAPSNLNETGRMIALALASLWRYGIEDAQRHIYVAGVQRLATLIVSKTPLTEAEISTLDKFSEEMGYSSIIHPNRKPESPLLAEMLSFRDEASLNSFAERQLIDVSAPTDSRPFFFNQLRLLSLDTLSKALSHDGLGSGTVNGNLKATLGLLFVVAVSIMAIIFILLIPTFNAIRDVSKSYARAGTIYFMLIGLGFMLVEIALIQRTSLFLGHPTYGLAIALFSLILATGIGSFISGPLNMTKNYNRLRLFPLLTFALLMLTIYVGPELMHKYESASITIRALVAVITITPPALLMGFAFPIGMNLAEKIDARPTPWLWAVNGAAGVLASGLAVIISMNLSIPVTLVIGALCYLVLLKPMSTLYALGK